VKPLKNSPPDSCIRRVRGDCYTLSTNRTLLSHNWWRWNSLWTFEALNAIAVLVISWVQLLGAVVKLSDGLVVFSEFILRGRPLPRGLQRTLILFVRIWSLENCETAIWQASSSCSQTQTLPNFGDIGGWSCHWCWIALFCETWALRCFFFGFGVTDSRTTISSSLELPTSDLAGYLSFRRWLSWKELQSFLFWIWWWPYRMSSLGSLNSSSY